MFYILSLHKLLFKRAAGWSMVVRLITLFISLISCSKSCKETKSGTTKQPTSDAPAPISTSTQANISKEDQQNIDKEFESEIKDIKKEIKDLLTGKEVEEQEKILKTEAEKVDQAIKEGKKVAEAEISEKEEATEEEQEEEEEEDDDDDDDDSEKENKNDTHPSPSAPPYTSLYDQPPVNPNYQSYTSLYDQSPVNQNYPYTANNNASNFSANEPIKQRTKIKTTWQRIRSSRFKKEVIKNATFKLVLPQERYRKEQEEQLEKVHRKKEALLKKQETLIAKDVAHDEKSQKKKEKKLLKITENLKDLDPIIAFWSKKIQKHTAQRNKLYPNI